MDFKSALSAIAIALTFAAFIPYVRSILRGQTKPHVFSWVIWGLVTIIVFFAQLAGGAGIGAWPIGVSGAISMSIAILAYVKRGDAAITRSDWAFLVLGLASIPAWMLTSDPLSAVILLTLADLLGFGPTFRKAWVRPFEEQTLTYALVGVRNFIAIAALEHFSWTTVLFPAVVGASCFVFVPMVLYRRRVIAGTE